MNRTTLNYTRLNTAGVPGGGKATGEADKDAMRTELEALRGRLDTIVGGDASKAIDSFNEIVAFLASVEDTETLRGIVAAINQEIADVRRAIPERLSQLKNDNHTVTDAAYVHTDNNYTDGEKRKVERLHAVPTLDHVPGEDDTAFGDDDGRHDFHPGDLARVPDAESSTGFSFHILHDITSEGKAAWVRYGGTTGGGKTGVFILDTDGKLHKRGEWDTANNGKAVGVAVIAEKCRFVVGMKIFETRWPTLKGDINQYPLISGATATRDERLALQDYNGLENTRAIRNDPSLEGGFFYEILQYKFKNGAETYIGALGELMQIAANLVEINDCLSLIGAKTINEHYLTKSPSTTQAERGHAWRMDIETRGYMVEYNSVRGQAFPLAPLE